MLDIDPDREPDDTAAERAEIVLGRLYQDPDAVRRYHTVQALQDGRLREVAAVSMRQLRDELGSTDAAADALGISRQAINELLAKAGAPGARADRDLRERPAYQYGRYYDRVCAIAETHDYLRTSAHDGIGVAERAGIKLQDPVSQTLAMLPKLSALASNWLKVIRRARPQVADRLESELEPLAAVVAAWMGERAGDLRLTPTERADFILGMHQSSAARRAERKAKPDA